MLRLSQEASFGGHGRGRDVADLGQYLAQGLIQSRGPIDDHFAIHPEQIRMHVPISNLLSGDLGPERSELMTPKGLVERHVELEHGSGSMVLVEE